MTKDQKLTITPDQLAHIGEGTLGYIRKMRSEDVIERFQGTPDLQPGLDLWALFGADGTPILLSDNRTSAFYRAREDNLTPMSVH